MIELRQIVGRRAGKGGQVETIAQPVDFVIRDGKCVGTIARHSNASLCFNVWHLSEPEKEDIRREVERMRAGNTEFSGVAEKTSSPPQIPDDVAAEYSDEEETDSDE